MMASTTVQSSNTGALSSAMSVCVCGLPNAGKTELLAAFEQEAASHGKSICGHIVDLSSCSTEEQVTDADLILVAVDAAAFAANQEPHVEGITRFLQRLTEERCQRITVSGLPVIVVLTKFDLLAHAGVTMQSWLDRIENLKQAVAAILTKPCGDRPSFGAVDVHVWATSAVRPELADVHGPLSEPFGVSELFRQAEERVRSHRKRRRRTQRSLWWTLAGTLVALVSLFGLAIALIAFRPSLDAGGLAADVGLYRLLHENDPAPERLRAPLAPTIRRLAHIRNDPNFGKLPPADQTFVDDRLDEIDTYVEYKDRLESVNVNDIDTPADLAQAQQRLKSTLQTPGAYADAWRQTEAVRLYEELNSDLATLQDAIDRSLTWFDERLKEARELSTFARATPNDEKAWKEWNSQVIAVLQENFPHAEADFLPASHSVTYADVLRYEPVANASFALTASKTRLDQVRQLVSAIGLAGPAPDGKRPPLDIPKRSSLDDAKHNWRRLETLYPAIISGTNLPTIPDSITSQVRDTANKSYRHLLEVGRDVVQRRLAVRNASEERLNSWRDLLPWLAKPEELREWRQLTAALLRIIDPSKPDPIDELAHFIRRDHFDLDIRHATLVVPFQANLKPDGPLTIFAGPNESNVKPVLSLQLSGESSDVDRGVTTFSFSAPGDSAISFKPGEFLFARIPAKRNDDESHWMLTWARRRSEVFPFECMSLPPRLHREGQSNTEGQLLEHVHLMTIPENGIPKVPDLVPVVQAR